MGDGGGGGGGGVVFVVMEVVSCGGDALVLQHCTTTGRARRGLSSGCLLRRREGIVLSKDVVLVEVSHCGLPTEGALNGGRGRQMEYSSC